jgi:putative transposase
VVSPEARRGLVRYLQETYGVSQRRACSVLGQARSTQRRRPRATGELQRQLEARVLELVATHPRYGYRRIWALLRREGWRVNRKRVHRLWGLLGLRVPRKPRKRRSRGSPGNGCVGQPSRGKDHVWAWDFVYDRTTDGRALKWLTMVDEHTRECLLLEVARRMPSGRVLELIRGVMARRGRPGSIRSDNGPEFIATALREDLQARGIETRYIEPGSPWENGYAESFNGKVRDELLACEEFHSVLEARVVSGDWQRQYNRERPHSSLGYRTPEEFAESCPRFDSAMLRRTEDTPVTNEPTLTATGT